MPGLVRALGRRDLVGILVNTMVGSGMMAAPAKVFGLAHGWSFAVLGLSALVIIPMIVCFADLGSRFSGTGGPYLYARESLPGWMAFCAGWLLWVSQVFSTAALTNLLLTYLAGFLPALGGGLPRAALMLLFGALVTTITLRGVRGSVRTSNVMVVLKVSFVLAFVAVGSVFVHPDHFVARTPPLAPATLAQAVMIYIFAYAGFERAGVIAGEARTPREDVPWALFIAVAAATAAYAGVLLVCAGVLDNPSATDRPLAEVGRQLFGPVGAVAVSIGAVTVLVGTILVTMVATPRMLLAMADQGQAPAFLGAIHPSWRTPHVAIGISCTLTFAFAIFGDLLHNLTFSTAARVLCYILCCVGLWRLSRRADAAPALFRLPGRSLIAVASAAIFLLVLVVGATKELPALGAALAVGLVLFAFTRLRRSAGGGAVQPVVAESDGGCAQDRTVDPLGVNEVLSR
jgi:APA family basic amino acid/polyamine antiporter